MQGNLGMLRKAYYNWQISWNPGKKDVIEAAFKKVKEKLYHLKDIHGFKKPNWLNLKVPLGLRYKLNSKVKEFLMQKQVATT